VPNFPSKFFWSLNQSVTNFKFTLKQNTVRLDLWMLVLHKNVKSISFGSEIILYSFSPIILIVIIVIRYIWFVSDNFTNTWWYLIVSFIFQLWAFLYKTRFWRSFISWICYFDYESYDCFVSWLFSNNLGNYNQTGWTTYTGYEVTKLLLRKPAWIFHIFGVSQSYLMDMNIMKEIFFYIFDFEREVQ
jgi:hypothetical protein